MQRKVRVGLISTSWFAEWNLIPNTQSHPDAKLVSICGRQLDRAKDVAKRYGIEKVYMGCQPIHQCILLVYPTDYDKCEVLTEGDFERVKHP